MRTAVGSLAKAALAVRVITAMNSCFMRKTFGTGVLPHKAAAVPTSHGLETHRLGDCPRKLVGESCEFFCALCNTGKKPLNPWSGLPSKREGESR
jgi:hypothetical protein